ncbi:hypothetical protein [Bifidobacterium eulemuris]|uniref:Uncharacterized protein n=1 Tax=Bifidobacterium eulemuris TaxID=1765219 RepID=A0A261G7M6_9BIFI|nr:hypothetical protein [Bifidobacterium eulemuris]OZG67414.1 hypothetical protein BEUL_1505 [Bifidobacterium eulemuris]QOL32983.1 hypothetical protein BE0216_11445 [Bifidobacterium eulemuris]
MNDPIERHRHISITHTDADGTVTHTDVRITAVTTIHDDQTDDAACMDGAGVASRTVIKATRVDGAGDCFDPSTCCDEREQALIAALRSYLRPEQAPECLMARLRDVLDHCCKE